MLPLVLVDGVVKRWSWWWCFFFFLFFSAGWTFSRRVLLAWSGSCVIFQTLFPPVAPVPLFSCSFFLCFFCVFLSLLSSLFFTLLSGFYFFFSLPFLFSPLVVSLLSSLVTFSPLPRLLPSSSSVSSFFSLFIAKTACVFFYIMKTFGTIIAVVTVER